MNYEINDCGVCTNPKVVEEYKNKDCGYRVTVAYINNMWFYGSDAHIATAGMGTPCMADKSGYSTEDEARKAGLSKVHRWLQGTLSDIKKYGYHGGMGESTDGKPVQSSLQKAIENINRSLQYRQLELF